MTKDIRNGLAGALVAGLAVLFSPSLFSEVPGESGQRWLSFPSNFGSLVLPVPSEWTQYSDDRHYFAQFRRTDGKGLVRLSLINDPTDGFTLGQLERGFGAALWGAQELAERGTLSKEKLKGPGNQGFYLFYKRREPDPKGFSHRAQGAVLISGLSLNFMADYEADADRFVESIVELVRSARLRSVTERQLVLPGAGWHVSIDVTGLSVSESSAGRLLATDPRTDLILSAFVEQVEQSPTSETCRDKYVGKLGQSPLHVVEPLFSRYGEFELYEYLVENHGGQTINQKHIHGYLAHESSCIEIHVSQVGFRPKKYQAMLEQLARAVILPAKN
ncbi:MAG: hypothetical protein ACREAA_01335 [Candidatus Polarisedimenticolia bacterium]